MLSFFFPDGVEPMSSFLNACCSDRHFKNQKLHLLIWVAIALLYKMKIFWEIGFPLYVSFGNCVRLTRNGLHAILCVCGCVWVCVRERTHYEAWNYIHMYAHICKSNFTWGHAACKERLRFTLTLTLTLIFFLQPETTAIFGGIHKLCHSNYDLSTPTLTSTHIRKKCDLLNNNSVKS
jgi:hypothetical protein